MEAPASRSEQCYFCWHSSRVFCSILLGRNQANEMCFFFPFVISSKGTETEPGEKLARLGQSFLAGLRPGPFKNETLGECIKRKQCFPGQVHLLTKSFLFLATSSNRGTLNEANRRTTTRRCKGHSNAHPNLMGNLWLGMGLPPCIHSVHLFLCNKIHWNMNI